MIQLINTVLQQAQNIVNQHNLPPQAAAIVSHANAFVKQAGPEMLADISKINDFINAYQSNKTGISASINAWSAGNDQARVSILATLNQLQTQMSIVSNLNNKAGQDLMTSRNQFAVDAQTLTSLINYYRSQIAVLQINLQDKQQKMKGLQAQINLLRLNPFAWALGELVHLISDSKSYEQDIADTNNQLNTLNQQYLVIQMADSVAQQLSGNLALLSNALQNLVNSVNVTNGQMQQLESTAGDATHSTGAAIIFKAYFDTFDAQINDLNNFVNH